MKSELVPNDGSRPIPIVKDVTVVGRREFCDVQVADDSLSKRHAVLVRTDGLLMVRDLASTNGTKVNGQRVMWAALLPNDRLTLGRRKFKVYLGPDTAPSPSETYVPPRTAAGRATASPVATVPRAVPAPSAIAAPAPLEGFPPPTPIGLPIVTRNVPGSTDPDVEPAELDEFLVDDEDEQFLIDVD